MSKKILVVEDEPAIADNIKYALATEGFDVVWCSTAGDAADVLKHDAVDMVVLDVGLPDKNGFDFCKELRRTSSLPIIFLTARSDEIDKVVGLEIGGDDYLTKPFSPRELTARIRAVMRRTSSGCDEGTSRVDSSPLVVDKKKMVITYHGKPLDLSRYEFRLLEVLIGRPGWVFSRDKLMDLVWEEPEASLDRTVDTHIKTIRSKLKAIKPDVDVIKTHRGLGYSLKESV